MRQVTEKASQILAGRGPGGTVTAVAIVALLLAAIWIYNPVMPDWLRNSLADLGFSRFARERDAQRQIMRGLYVVYDCRLLADFSYIIDMCEEERLSISASPDGSRAKIDGEGDTRRIDNIATQVEIDIDGNLSARRSFILLPLREEYIIITMGPDGRQNLSASHVLSFEGRPQELAQELAEGTYDPTNGSASAGDIIGRFPRGISAARPSFDDFRRMYYNKGRKSANGASTLKNR